MGAKDSTSERQLGLLILRSFTIRTPSHRPGIKGKREHQLGGKVRLVNSTIVAKRWIVVLFIIAFRIKWWMKVTDIST